MVGRRRETPRARAAARRRVKDGRRGCVSCGVVRWTSQSLDQRPSPPTRLMTTFSPPSSQLVTWGSVGSPGTSLSDSRLCHDLALQRDSSSVLQGSVFTLSSRDPRAATEASAVELHGYLRLCPGVSQSGQLMFSEC